MGQIVNIHWDHSMMDFEPASKRGKGRPLKWTDDTHRLFYTLHFPVCQSERRHANRMFVCLKFRMEAIKNDLIFRALNRVDPYLFFE